MLAQLSQDIINIDSSYFSHSAKLIKAQTIWFPCCHIECEAQHSSAPIENPMSETARTKEVKECEKREGIKKIVDKDKVGGKVSS